WDVFFCLNSIRSIRRNRTAHNSGSPRSAQDPTDPTPKLGVHNAIEHPRSRPPTRGQTREPSGHKPNSSDITAPTPTTTYPGDHFGTSPATRPSRPGQQRPPPPRPSALQQWSPIRTSTTQSP